MRKWDDQRCWLNEFSFCVQFGYGNADCSDLFRNEKDSNAKHHLSVLEMDVRMKKYPNEKGTTSRGHAKTTNKKAPRKTPVQSKGKEKQVAPSKKTTKPPTRKRITHFGKKTSKKTKDPRLEGVSVVDNELIYTGAITAAFNIKAGCLSCAKKGVWCERGGHPCARCARKHSPRPKVGFPLPLRYRNWYGRCPNHSAVSWNHPDTSWGQLKYFGVGCTLLWRKRSVPCR